MLADWQTEGWELVQDFKNLDAWSKAHQLVLTVYSATRTLPREEIFGITMQLRRAATAVPMRIAEACGGEVHEMSRELRRAAAMTSDLEYLVLLAGDLELFDEPLRDRLMADVVEVRKMIFGLIRSR
jgi:four helix bundle protein